MKKFYLKSFSGLLFLLLLYYKVDLKTLLLYIFKNKIKKEKEKMIQSFKKENNEYVETNKLQINTLLPQNPKLKSDIIKELICLLNLSKINKTKISGCLYTSNNQLDLLLNDCFSYFHRSNPLHPDVYPGVRKMEAEIITICGKLMNSPTPDAGSFTTGGTESILLACKAYRDKYNKKNPEIIVHTSAHAAYWKAGQYFNINIIEIEDFHEINITENTIAVVCSAPTFNYGLIDPISKVSSMCKQYGVGLHVDACLGGFLTPFLKTEVCDFRLEGVTSISIDTHKYGNGPKGGSVILYRDKELFKKQMFVKDDWSGGIYATSNLTGSRDGNVVALTWTTMMYTGYNKYKKNAEQIQYLVKYLRDEINKIEELVVFGNPEICAVAIGSNTYNILLLCDELKVKGWNLNILQNPNSFHFCITNVHTKDTIDDLLEDIKELNDKLKDKKNTNTTSKSIYGTTQKIKGTEIIDDVAREYLYCLNTI